MSAVSPRLLRSIGRWGALPVLAAAFGFPLYWLVTMAFKPVAEWNPPGRVVWVPDDPTLDNFRLLFRLNEGSTFTEATFRSAVPPIVHSLVAAVGGTGVALVFGVFAAYGIARFRAGGRRLPFQILQLRMFPPVLLVIPLLFFWVELGLWDSYQGLVLVYGALTFPFVVWLMRSFFLEVPRELSEAAIVDGCTLWGAFFKAVLPQVKGGLAATALFVFILNWSDLLLAQVLTQDRIETATVYLNGLHAEEVTLYGPQAALGLLLVLPSAVIGIAIRRYLVRGLTFGAIRR